MDATPPSPTWWHRLAERYGFGGRLRFDWLASGENHSFLIECDGRLLVLRVYRADRHSDEAIRAEHALLRDLSGDVHVPGVLANRDGDTLTVLAPDQDRASRVAIFTLVPGETIETPDASNWRAFGAAVASLLRALDRADRVSGEYYSRVRPRLDPATLVTRPAAELAAAAPSRSLARRIEDAAEALDRRWRRAPDRRQLLHGDLQMGNTLRSDRRTAFIDFDDCGAGPIYYDLATPLCAVGLESFPDAAAALIDSYREEQLLRSDEERWLTLFLAVRRFWLLWWQGRRCAGAEIADWPDRIDPEIAAVELLLDAFDEDTSILAALGR